MRVRYVSCNGDMFAAVDMEGTLFTWGDGSLNGHDDEWDFKESPMVVAALVGQQVTMVSCGNEHAAAVTARGQLWTWGNGDYGKLGSFDPHVHRYVPKRVNRSGLANSQLPTDSVDAEYYEGLPGGEAALARGVSCGNWHTVVAMASGKVCTFGHDEGAPGVVAALPSLDEDAD